MLLILVVVIGGALFWGWQDSPPDTPTPAAASAPTSVPGGSPPAP
jgi:hypothetical protein